MTEQRRIVTPSPENSETPIGDVPCWVTPNRLFFVRNHFDVPAIERTGWRLRMDGLVDRACELTWDELASLPQRSVFATVECAGNGRSFLQPRVEGVQWGAGAVGHAEWTGVPLRLVLQHAGLQPDVTEIVCEGADRGLEHDHPGVMPFARSLPLEKAAHPDTLLALRMNGELLEPEHGAPVRLLAPGWYGVASVKWLVRLEAADQPFQGYFQAVKYTIRRRTGRGTQVESVGAMPVKSEIVGPREHDVLGIGTTRVFGLAWAGEDAVAAVEVSVDGGRSWNQAELVGPRAAYSWTLWEYPWEVADPGEHLLLSRAISAGGQVQPLGHDSLRGGYLVTFSRPTRVRVDASRRSRAFVGDRRSLLDEMSTFAEERARMRLDVEMAFTHGGGI